MAVAAKLPPIFAAVKATCIIGVFPFVFTRNRSLGEVPTATRVHPVQVCGKPGTRSRGDCGGDAAEGAPPSRHGSGPGERGSSGNGVGRSWARGGAWL